MSYDDAAKMASMKYIKDKQQEIKLRYRKEEFEREILPAIKRSGMPVASFIKEAVAEKIIAMNSTAYDLTNVLERVKTATIEVIPAIMPTDCRRIILYGSCARGDYSKDSDVDIAILTDSDREEIKKYEKSIDEAAAKIGKETLAVVNYLCLPISEFEEKKSWYPFFMNIDRDGVLLYER